MSKKNLVFNSLLIVSVATFSVKFMQYKANLAKRNSAVQGKPITNIDQIVQNAPILNSSNAVSHTLSMATSNNNIQALNTGNVATNSLITNNPTLTPSTPSTPSLSNPSSLSVNTPSIPSVITPSVPTPSVIQVPSNGTSTVPATADATSVVNPAVASILSNTLLASSFYVGMNTTVTTAQNLPNPLYGGTLTFGYKPIKVLAIEANYNYMTGSQYGANVNTNSFGVSAKGVLSASNFSFYAKSGVSYQVVTSNGEITGVKCGTISLCNGSSNNYPLVSASVGASYSFTNHIEAKVENTQYVPAGNSVTGAMSSSAVGIQYNF